MRTIFFVFALFIAWSRATAAQTVSLAPAAVDLRGEPGQSTTQSFTLSNGTPVPLSFELEAIDVIVRDGQRVRVGAGELPGSVAATASLSQRRVTVAPGAESTVEVTVTLPKKPAARGILVLWRGTTLLAKGATTSLGSMMTFALSDERELNGEPLAAIPQTENANARFEEELVNSGPEPLATRGVAVILDAQGALVGRAEFEALRLLPGERRTAHAEYAGELLPGHYRVLSTFEVPGHPLTGSAELVVR